MRGDRGSASSRTRGAHPTPIFHISFSPYCGAHGILGGALVALKQVAPESEVTLLGWIKFRVRQLPALYCTAAVVVGLLTRSLLGTVPAVMGGAYAAWLYLRFGQARPGLELRCVGWGFGGGGGWARARGTAQKCAPACSAPIFVL